MREHGFWDYTTPSAGGMERYALDDYRLLLDDMAEAGMNSLVIVVKWFTTGYRSRLPFLDQQADNPIIASDNLLLRQVLGEATARGIRVRLGAVVSAYEIAHFGQPAFMTISELSGARFPTPVGYYDADTPGVQERAVAICTELVELFPEADGLMVELEFTNREMPHRIPRYEQWAAEHGYPSFAELGHPLNLQYPDIPGWRAYTTHRRTEILQEIEHAVRAQGFAGSLCTICETGRSTYTFSHDVDLALLQRRCPQWDAVTYEYDKYDHRYAMMDLCIDTPKRAGLATYYLARGVMTWADPWPLPISLPQSWRMDVADILQFQPDGVWWFGTGTRNEGIHVCQARLHTGGFADGRAARRALLDIAAALGRPSPSP